MTDIPEERPCVLCGDKVPAPHTDYYCFGCKEFVCDKHTGMTGGHGHSPDDHDSPEEDED